MPNSICHRKETREGGGGIGGGVREEEEKEEMEEEERHKMKGDVTVNKEKQGDQRNDPEKS